MKHFYNFNFTVLVQHPSKAFEEVFGNKTRRYLTLTVLSMMLLLSGKSFGATFTISSNQTNSGNWNTSGWTITNATSTTGTFPGPEDDVVIEGKYTVILPTTDNPTWKSLTLRFNTGNSTPGITIDGGLTVGNLSIDASNNATNSKASVIINGNLVINGTGTWAANGKYDFKCGTASTVTYNGSTNIIIPQVTTVSNNNAVTTFGPYNNLILSGTGAKTATANLEVVKDLTIRNSAEFVLGSFSHRVGGNLIIESTTAKMTGNSTTTGLGLTVDGNLTNSGTITFQTRILTVAKNFTNNAVGTFIAGAGAHTVSGNWDNGGAFTAGGGTITLNGTSKTISSTGTGSFNNLTLSNGTSDLLSNITVNNELRLNTTIVDTKTFKAILGPSANILSEENATQQIKGTVETTRIVGSGASDVFGNMGFRITGSGADLGSVTVRRVTGTPFTSPVNNNTSVNRQFYVSNASGSLSGLNTAIEMNFPAHDIPAPAAASYDIYRNTVVSGNNVIETLANASVDPTYKYKVNNAQKFGMYTISSNVTPLPVELAWFKAERQAKGVNLTWQTASEKDNSGFEVQVSTDGKHFSKAGFVKSAVTTSSVAQRYSFLHQNLAAGTRYYRLAQIDLDGTTTYSNVKAIDMNGLKTALAAYPNPFEGQVTLQLPTGAQREVRAILTNAFGQVLSEQKADVSELGQLTVDMSSAKTSGIYFLQVADNGSKHTFKLMKK